MYSNLFNDKEANTVSVDAFVSSAENSSIVNTSKTTDKQNTLTSLSSDQISIYNNNNSLICTPTLSTMSLSPSANECLTASLSCAVCGDISSGKHYGIFFNIITFLLH